MKPAANRSYCPRLSEAVHVLPLIRGYLAAAAPRPLATTIDLVPIVEDGLFGYELVPERDLRVYPVIGCNAQGEPLMRVTSFGAPARGMRLVTNNGGIQLRSGRIARLGVRSADTPFPNWFAAAEAAWAYLRQPSADLRAQTPVRREKAHRRLERALAIAHSHIHAWDPCIEFLGLPNEAQLGFALEDRNDGHGMLIFQRPDTWSLRWNAPDAAVSKSWSRLASDLDSGDRREDGERRSADRRALRRRASDRGVRDAWQGEDRRRARGRRAIDRFDP